jgi:hypothetical protein
MSGPANWQSSVDSLIPDTFPNGTALSNPGTAAGVRYFKFTFTTTDTTSMNAYMTGNNWAGNEELIISIYVTSDNTSFGGNIINTTNIINIQSGVNLNTTNSSIGIPSNFSNLAFTIQNLQINTSYTIITRTIYNDSGNDLAIYFNSIQTNTKIPITYTETATIPFTPVDWPLYTTNMIPDVNPDNSALSNPGMGSGQRYFKFSFTTDDTTTTASLFVKTNSKSFTEEYFFRFYRNGFYTNFIDGASISNIQSGVNSSGDPLLGRSWYFNNNFSNFAFNFYNLASNTIYYIITRTSFNDDGPDVEFFLQSVQTSRPIPITYTETTSNTSLYQPTIPTNPEIPYVTLSNYSNAPNSGADYVGMDSAFSPQLVSYPLILYHNVDFQYGAYKLRWLNTNNTVNIVDAGITGTFTYNHSLGRYILTFDGYGRSNLYNNVWFTTTLATVTLTNLHTLPNVSYGTDINSIKSITYPITLYDNVDYTFNSYTLRYIASINEIYFYISTTLTLKFNYNNTFNAWVCYYDINNRSSVNNGTVFLTTNSTVISSTPVGWQSNITSIIPDVNPDNSPLSNPGLESGIRFFLFSFTTDTNRFYLDFFITTLSSSSNSNFIVSIFKSNSSSNLINNNNIFNIQSNVSLDSNEQRLQFSNSFNGLAFSLKNLDINSTYYIITKTIHNSTGPDIGLYLQSQYYQLPTPLTYFSTTNSQILYKNSLFSTTNIIPDLNPNSTPLSNPALGQSGDRLFRFSFTTPSTNSLTFYFTSLTNTQSIVYLFKENTFRNYLSLENIFNIQSSITSFDETNSIININTNLYGSEGFSIKNIFPNTTYYFFSKTTSNSTGSDIGMAILSKDTDSFISNITYEATDNNQTSIQFPTSVPGPPDIFIRPDAQDQKVTFYWSYPQNDGNSPISSYLLSSISHNCNIIFSSNTNGQHTLSSLTNNVEYSFQLAASNSIGLGAFSMYRSVKPGPYPSAMEISSVTINYESGSIAMNSILNSSINTPPIKYIIYTSIPLGQSRFNPTVSQVDIFFTNTSTSIINLNKNTNWNVFATAVNDPGYSPEVSTIIIFNNPNTNTDPESTFFRTHTNATNTVFFYRSTLQSNSISPVSSWTMLTWRANAFGLATILRSISDSRIYRCQFYDKLFNLLSTSGEFYGPATPSNFFGALDAPFFYGLYPSTNNLLNYLVFNCSTNTLVLSTLENVSSIGFDNSSGTLHSYFVFSARSNTTLTPTSNLYYFNPQSNNINTYHPTFFDTVGSIVTNSNTIDRKFYLICRPSLQSSGIYNKIYCFNNSTSFTSFNITSYNISVLNINNVFSKNILNIVDSANNFVFNFDLPQSNNPILSNAMATGTVTSQFTRFPSHNTNASTFFSSWRQNTTVNASCNLNIFSPSSSNIYSTAVANTTYTSANSPSFNVIAFYSSPSLFTAFATIDIAGNFSTYTTNFLSNGTSRVVAGSNANSIIYRLSNSSNPNQSFLYTFTYFNSTINFYSTLVNCNCTAFNLTSNSVHNYLGVNNGLSFYIPINGPPSLLGISATIFRNLTPPNNTAFGANSNGQIFVFSNDSLISTLNTTLVTTSNFNAACTQDACFFYYRTGGLCQIQRISTNGYYTAATNTTLSNQFTSIGILNFFTPTRRGVVINNDSVVGATNRSQTLLYNWNLDTFENYNTDYYGTSNQNTYSNSYSFF